MASNKYNDASNADLRALATQMIAAMGASPATWGATATQIANLTAKNATFGTAMTNAASTRAAAKAATAAQTSAREGLIDDIQVLAKQMYAKSGLTPEQIAATGLAVHDTDRSTIVPSTPTNFVATPFANSTVKLKWNRNGNPYGVIFFLEASIEGGPWTQVFGTKRASTTLAGFAPGVQVTFRVVAVNEGYKATPSLTQTIYQAESPVSLKMAA